MDCREERPPAILFIDDCPVMRGIYTKLFEQEGFYVHCYESPSAAINDVRDGIIYDIALVDTSFPKEEMGGDDIIHALKDIHPHKPAGTFSGYDYSVSGADFHIKKGENRENIIYKIRSKLRTYFSFREPSFA